ncbi:MAG: DUF2029 domain-containing protein [Deltaproteobacteria bacterium]|nr:DUF2029 domain-containing protein [Deltaproteobacteria bacterium]
MKWSCPMFSVFRRHIGLFFLLFLGYMLSRTLGNYSLPFLIFYIVFFLVFLWTALRTDGSDSLFNVQNTEWLLALGILFFCLRLSHRPQLIYSSEASLISLQWILMALAADAVVILLVFLVRKQRSRPLWIGSLTGLGLLLCFAARILVLFASPMPHIDVFNNNSLAAQHLLSLENPYNQLYPDIYGGTAGYPPSFSYLPGLLFWIVPAQYFFSDIRVAFIFADLGTLVFLILLGRKIGLGFKACFLLPLLWLSFAPALFILEQSFIDPLLVFLAAACLFCLATEKFLWAGVSLGLMCATKQYSIFVPIISVYWIYKNAGSKKAAVFLSAAFMVFAVALLPFVLASPGQFYRSVVTLLADHPLRPDSFSIVALCLNEWNIVVPSSLSVLVYCVVLLGLLRWLAMVPVLGLRHWASALFILYGIVFLFGKMAFCNYYYFEAFFLLLVIYSGYAGHQADACNVPQKALLLSQGPACGPIRWRQTEMQES